MKKIFLLFFIPYLLFATDTQIEIIPYNNNYNESQQSYNVLTCPNPPTNYYTGRNLNNHATFCNNVKPLDSISYIGANYEWSTSCTVIKNSSNLYIRTTQHNQIHYCEFTVPACQDTPPPANKQILQLFTGDTASAACNAEIDRLGGINGENGLQCWQNNCDSKPFPDITLFANNEWSPSCPKPADKISTPFTQEQCNLDHASSIVNDTPNFLSEFQWNYCDSTCYATLEDCPKSMHTKNNVCVDPKEDMSCPVSLDCNEWSIGVSPEKTCNLSCKCQDVPFETIEISCIDFDSNSTDSNSTNSDSNSTTGGGSTGGDTNSTNTDSNSSTGGGSTDSNSTNPDSNSTTGGGSTGGGTNSDGEVDGKDSNSTGYEESAQQGKDRTEIDGKLTDIYKALDDIKKDFDNLLNNVKNGFTISSISSGSNPKFCATVFNKVICLDLCETFSSFQSIFYFIFTIVFLFASIRIYFNAFKMRT